MKIVDLCCGAGGASVGLKQAFPDAEITGVDVRPQPHYPFKFIQSDALTFDLANADFVWASWPCQAWTAYKRRPGYVFDSPDLITPGRQKLQQWGGQWVMENIQQSPLHATVLLCGSMFGLDIRRHRYFETTFPVLAPPCQHKSQAHRFVGASNFPQYTRRTVEVGVWRIPLDVQQKAMGIDWMTKEELSEAVPPAYSKYLSSFLF